MSKYDDIIDMEQPIDKNHPRMSLHNRAAQFAPFDALTGFGGRIYETSRLTDTRIELTDEEKQTINLQLCDVAAHIKERPVVTITFFVPDKTKDGGTYHTISAIALKIDTLNECLYLEEDMCIHFDDMTSVQCII